MPWAPTVAEELRNDVRVALRFKVGRKQQPLTDTERDMVAAAIVEQNEASGEEPIIEPCRDGAFQTHGRPRHLPILGPFLGGRQFIALASIARRPLASGQRRTVTGQLAING
jgi:hypothetical protein